MSLPPPICMVLLSEPVAFDHDAVGVALAEAFPAEVPVQLESVSEDGETLMVRIDDRMHTVMALPAPVPMESFAASLNQPDSDSLRVLAQGHGAHLIVTCLQPGAEMGEAVVAASMVHLLAMSLGAAFGAQGAFWSASERLCPWDEFCAYSAALAPVMTGGEPDFPSRYWVSIGMTQEDERFGGATQGLLTFTGYEVEMTPIDWPLQDVATRLLGVVSYLFSAGPVLKDGDTLGVSEDERFGVEMKDADKKMLLTIKGGEH